MHSFNPEQFMIDDTRIEEDYNYFRRLAPASTYRLYDSIEEVCDRLEYEGSFLYDESPDKTTLLDLTKKVSDSLEPDMGCDSKDLILLILCQEILYRRCRYYRKMKLFDQ